MSKIAVVNKSLFIPKYGIGQEVFVLHDGQAWAAEIKKISISLDDGDSRPIIKYEVTNPLGEEDEVIKWEEDVHLSIGALCTAIKKSFSPEG